MKELIINCKKTKCTLVSKKYNPRCGVRIGDIIMRKFTHLGNNITEDGRYGTKVNFNSVIFLTISKKYYETEQLIRNKENKAEPLCHPIWQWMFNILQTDGEEAWGNRYVGLQKDNENTIDRGSFKEKENRKKLFTQNQNDTV